MGLTGSFFFYSFFHDVMATFRDRSKVLNKPVLCMCVCVWRQAWRAWLSYVVLILVISTSPGLPLPSLLLHLGICLLQASEVSNWLFSCVRHNWVLITVLHSVLIFKSAMSSERRASRSLTFSNGCCTHVPRLIRPFTLRPDSQSAGDTYSIHHQGLKDKALLMASHTYSQ